ncbi:uncharacterized protein LOC143028511 [Oratosquilla oratoria]|uniref:uncharacterized protein LOC143028511 n=1 Tax=Oratosquilla oratoria TaxID=337810 RepID=UPI003F76A6AB
MTSVFQWTVLVMVVISVSQARPQVDNDAERVLIEAGKPIEPKVPVASRPGSPRYTDTVYEIVVSTDNLEVNRKKKRNRPKPGPIASRLITGPDPFVEPVASPVSFSGAELVFNSPAKVEATS